MKWKSLFAAALTAAVALPAWAQDATGGGIPSLSFSFANNRDGSKLAVVSGVVEADTEIGVEPVPANKWIELYDSDAGSKAINNTETVSANDERAHNFTLESDVTVTYSAKNAWSVKDVADQASSSIQPFLQSYLDDGDNPAVDGNTVGAKFTVTGIPFESYDVIIYFATDKEFTVGSDNGFLPVTVNGTAYSWTQWQSETDSGYLVSDADSTAVFGSAPENAAILGKNAIRIPALSGDLTVTGPVGDGQTSKRCSIAAFQIVEAKPSININFAQTADDPYDVPASGAYGLAPVPGAFWQNIYGASGTDVALSLDGYNLLSDTKLTFSAPGTWRFPNDNQVKDPILKGFLGIATNASNGSTVSVTDIPFTQYDVIVYFATNEENAVFQPVTINEKSYTWDSETQTTVEGETTFGSSRGLVSEYGRNALRITGLTGDLSLQTGAQTVKTETEPFKTGNLCGIQIICTGEVTDAAVPLERNPTISVNIADVRTPNAQGGTLSNPDADVSTTGVYGLAPVPGNAWANLRPATVGTDGTETITKAYACGFATPVRVSYQASGTWEYVGAEGGTPVDSFLRYYLDDGVSANGQKSGADIYVTNIPFSKYDVIVYLATDSDGEKFNPVEINGILYKGTEAGSEEASGMTDVWGTVRQTAPALGANALRVSGLEGNLRIHGGTKQTVNNQVARGGIAAFQIVLADDGEILEKVDPDRGVLSLNFNSGRNNAAVPDTNAFYGLDAVPGWAWYDSPKNYGNDGSTAITSKETVSTAYGSVLESSPRVTISAANGYFYSSNDPFMRAYLDDNARVNISSEVPYDYYDVIVYSATDGTGSRFQAVGVNGTDYRWRDDQGKPVVAGVGELFGYGGRDAAFGQNAQRINGQTANPLTIAPRTRSGTYRSGIAAIQIIERPVQEITVNASMTAQQVFAQSLPGRAPKLVFVEGGAITGAVNLSGVAVDLTQVASSPFTGALTVDANTKLYLPAGTRTYALTAGTVTGSLAAANVFIGGTAIPAGAMTQNGASLTFDIEVTYNWTGAAGDNLWSTPDNWSSGVVPGADSEVTVSLNANDAKTIVIDTAEATANLFYISGPQTGSARLSIETAENVEGAKLTVVDKMFTTGNVSVTQKANIGVAGTSQMGDGSPIPANQVVQAGFQVNGSRATYTVESGALVVQEPDSTVGDVSVSNGATLEVSAGGTLTAAQAIASYFGNATSAVSGTLSIAGTATFSKQVAFRNDGLTMELAGGTLTTPSVRTFHGLTVSEASKLVAPEGQTMTVSGTNSALSGEGNLTLQGAVTFSTITADYTGELTAAAGSTVTLGENRPKLSVAEDATVNITPTAEEQAAGRIAFGTSMAAVPTATFTVEGVDAVTPAVDNGTLTLSWAASTATLSTTGNWSAFNWTVGETTGQAAPESGVVVLDGTAGDGITVTLDTAIPAAITTINVRGDVTLVAKEQQLTLPTCINVEDGATLGVDANFAKANGSTWPDTWDIPANTTLRVTGDSFDFDGITVDNNGYIQVYADLEVTATGTEGTPAVIEPSANLWCRGKVKVSGSYVKLKKLYWLDDVTDGLTVTGNNVTIEGLRQVDGTEGLTLSGNNVRITGDVNDFAFAAGATITSSGTGNVLDGLTDLPTELHVTGGDLTIDSCATLGGALLTNGATLKLASDWASGQELKVSAGDNSATTLDLSAINPANRPTLNRYSDTHKTLPKTIIVAPSVEETEAGVIDITLLQDLVPAADTVVQVVAEPAWNPAWEVVTEGGKKLRITNVVLKPVLPEGSTLSEAATAALNAAAEQAGITGEYAVAITTGDATVQVTTAEAATRLQEVLECFTGLTLKASTEGGNTVTVVYDFGIVGIKRDTAGDGWVVTAKVQGANAEAGFAEGNVYTLTVNGTEVSVAGATVGEGGTVTLPLADTEVQGDGPLTLGVKVSRPEPTPAQ